MTENFRVTVIGAGMAGLATAAKLVQNGIHDVIVLEAQDNFGGRVQASDLGSVRVDLGAQFIHGKVDNPLYKLADALGKVTYVAETDQQHVHNDTFSVFYLSNGDTIRKEEVQDLITVLDAEFSCAVLNDLPNTNFKEEVNYEQSEDLNFAAEKVLAMFLKKKGGISKEMTDIYKGVFNWYIAYILADNAACSLSDLHSWVNDAYINFPGNRFYEIEGGMYGIVEAVRDLLPKDMVRLNTRVSNIDWSQADAVNPHVIVNCENGSRILSDYVVITPSVAVLQRDHGRLFTPSLPLATQQALSHVELGAIGKIYLQFNEPFWDLEKDFVTFEILWLDHHDFHIESDKCLKKTKSGKSWWYGFFAAESIFGNCLEIWLLNEQVRIMETVAEEEVMAVLTEALQKLLPKANVTSPTRIARTKWVSNPDVLGTYSFAKTNFTEEDLKHFGKPLPSRTNPRLMFAGEAYDIRYMSALHGALTTGEDAAGRILDIHNIKNTKSVCDVIKQKANI